MVYELPARAKQAMGLTKRERQFDRTLRYIEELDARFVFPTAGPPCFLDDELWGFNDIFGDESNIFPDQVVYLDWLRDQGPRRGPAAAARARSRPSTSPAARSSTPTNPTTIYASDETKTAYLRDMQARRQPEVEALKADLGAPRDRRARLAGAVVHAAARGVRAHRAGIDGGVRLTCEDAERGDVDVLIDFVGRQVRAYDGEKVRYRFRTRRAYVEQLIAEHEIDWVNSLFLSCRFSAQRIGPYNEFVYVFFKCLSEERLNYAEGWFARAERRRGHRDDHAGEQGRWDMQRRCPHLKADLSRFGIDRGRRHDLPDARLEVAAVRRQVPVVGRATTCAARRRASRCRRWSRSSTTGTTVTTTPRPRRLTARPSSAQVERPAHRAGVRA